MNEPIHTLSLGCGVQSSTAALMAAHGEIDPMPYCGIFADTFAEPKSVYDWFEWIKRQLPFPVYRVWRGDLEAEALKMRTTKDGRSYTITSLPYYTLSANGKEGKIPHRTCTSDYKIKPILAHTRSLFAREKMLEWRRKHAGALKALAEWKKACKLAKKNDERAIAFERAIARLKGLTTNFHSRIFLHKSCKPLDQVDFRPADEQNGQTNLFNQECEGMCGV